MTEQNIGDMKIDQTNGESYQEFLEIIRHSMDPSSNTVLVVDDERGIRMRVARDVKTCDPGLVIFEASNGKEALEKLVHIRKNYFRDPVLMVLDLQMPVMDGWALIEHLKEEYETHGKSAGIPIIVLSSTSGEKNYALVRKKSIHDDKTGYTPLISVAKETCVDKSRYDASGETGLLGWLSYFVREK